MKLFITILSSIHCFCLFGQASQNRVPIRSDSCYYHKQKIGASTIGYNPLIIANSIVTSLAEVNPDSVIDIKVLQCPESSRKFGYIAAGGAVVINTKQIFAITTPKNISDNKHISGEIIYALNGLLLLDSALSISSKAVDEFEIYCIDNNKGGKVTYINIWTLPKAYRKE